MTILGIEEKDFLNKNLIKIYNGIAGASKSTAIDNYFADNGIHYIRCNSTNRQKFDANERFGENCTCFTSASGLFKTHGTIFYYEEKEVEAEHVVIDEILLSSRKVLDWVKNHVGQLNIIISTDDRQLLAPGQERMLQEFHELEESDISVVSHLTYSKRPVNEETRAKYNELYNAEPEAKADLSGFPTMKFSELEYNHTDVYLTHTREIEVHLYNEFDLYNDYEAELVGKAMLASRESYNKYLYPIVPQERAEKEKFSAYMQIAKVGTPTRYQGSEVMPNEKLYYIINPHSLITNREFYTVLTRCKDMNSLVIVYADWNKESAMHEFFGKPIKKEIPVVLKGEYREPTNEDEFDKLWTAADKEADSQYIYNYNLMIVNGKPISRVALMHQEEEKAPISILNQFKKEGVFAMNGEQVYQAIDGKINAIHSTHQKEDNDTHIKDCSFRFQLDLHSAYTHVLVNEYLPVYSEVTKRWNPNKMNFYEIIDDRYTKNGVITDDMQNWCHQHGIKTRYLFSVDKKKGSKTGNKLFKMVYKDKKSKDKVKLVRWGVLQKHFLEGREFNRETGEPQSYVKNDAQCYELLMAAITSQLLFYMVQLQEVVAPTIPGFITPTRIVTDAIHYCYTAASDEEISNTAAKADKLIAWMAEHMPGYDFRIKNNLTGEVIYQSYNNLN